MKRDVIEISFRLLLQYFSNTRILSLEELRYLIGEITDTEDQLITTWYQDMIDMHYLQALPGNATELFVNNNFYYKANGYNHEMSSSIDSEHWQLHFEIICYQNQVEWSYSHPFSSFYLKTKEKCIRLSLTHYSLTPNKKSYAFMRVLNPSRFPLESFSQSDQSRSLIEMIKTQANLLVAGATGSGKTSFLSSLMGFIRKDDHVILLEDTKEILPHQNTTELISGKSPKSSLKSLCEYSLRMSPDRLVIGEMRSREVIPFFLMMNTGHKGLMSTVHANSAIDAIHRCAFLFSIYGENDSIKYESSLKIVAQNVDYVIFLKNKKVDQIIKVLGSENDHCFFETIHTSVQTNEKSSCKKSFWESEYQHQDVS